MSATATVMFSEQEVERLRQRERETFEKKLEARRAEQAKEILDLQARLPDPGKMDPEEKLRHLERQNREELQGLHNQLTSLAEQLTAENKKTLETERDLELGKALTKANCRDQIGGMRYTLPAIKYESDEARWLFHNSKGMAVSIETGVETDLPDYLRSTPAQRNGVNGQAPKPKLAAKQQRLTVEQEKLLRLTEKARNSGGKTSDVVIYRKQLLLVTALAKELDGQK